MQAGLLAPFVLACSRAAEQSNSKKPPEAALAFAPPTFAYISPTLSVCLLLLRLHLKSLIFQIPRLHSAYIPPTLRSTHFFCALAMERGLFAQYSYADLSDVDMDSSAATLILSKFRK